MFHNSKTFSRLVFCALLALPLTCTAQSPSAASNDPADVILINGKIITVDAHDSIAEALAIHNGKIVAVGTNDEIREPRSKIRPCHRSSRPHCHSRPDRHPLSLRRNRRALRHQTQRRHKPSAEAVNLVRNKVATTQTRRMDPRLPAGTKASSPTTATSSPPISTKSRPTIPSGSPTPPATTASPIPTRCASPKSPPKPKIPPAAPSIATLQATRPAF